ncbi:MAG: proton-conducting transporter membrane subunit [Myxococcota bacterium]|nr:proton-conducting transporter membrane subunit [Myxococcota bacterium]
MEWMVPFVFGVGALAPALHTRLRVWSGPVLALVPAGIALYAAARQPAISDGAVPEFRASWIPSLGIDWAFRQDGLSNLFVLLVAGIGALIVVYAGAYLREHPRLGRFYAFLFVFMGAMLGLVTADDLFLLFVFWELTTVSSFLLIALDHEKEAARKAALQSLLVTAAGGLAMLAGFILLVDAAGTSAISQIVLQGESLRAHASYPWILALILLGAFTKSAQVPFHFWLPAAMQAPTPASAYLHSSTMVKAGVFLLARLSPALGGSDAWAATLLVVGAATTLLGGLLALSQDDLKRLLAYSTVSVLGLLTLLLGLGTPIAAQAFVVTLLAHAFYKGALFLVAGNVDHGAGSRLLSQLGGLREAMPWTAAAALLAGLSMAGGPPLFGFLAKETAYEAVLEAPVGSWLLAPLVIGTAVTLVFAAIRVGLSPFKGELGEAARDAHDAGPAMRLGPLVLATTGVLAGLLVGPAERLLVAPAASVVLQGEAPTGLALWHGFTPILALSLLTLAAGAFLYRHRERVVAAAAPGMAFERRGPAWLWDRGWELGLAAAARGAHAFQNGSLRRYLVVTLGVGFAVVALSLPLSDLRAAGPTADTPIVGIAASLLVVFAAAVMARARTPFLAVAALGAVGFGVSLLFLMFSAPDLALTQLVVEVLTVVLLALVLPRLPRPAKPKPARAVAIGVAVLGGATMAGASLVAMAGEPFEPISRFFEERSVIEAHGRNIVNVILVDFRALDTLGEITVLAVTALGILTLLRRRRPSDAEVQA